MASETETLGSDPGEPALLIEALSPLVCLVGPEPDGDTARVAHAGDGVIEECPAHGSAMMDRVDVDLAQLGRRSGRKLAGDVMRLVFRR